MSNSPQPTAMTFLPGDIAACFGNDWTSLGISAVTASLLAPRYLKWAPSHVAMVCERYEDMLWVESTTFCPSPCLIHGGIVHGAQAHRPQDRIQHYLQAGGRVDLYRLTALNRLSTAESKLLTQLLIDHFVKPQLNYDYHGAILSGTRAFQWSRLFPTANLNELFCSELVASVVMRMNRLNHANPSRFHPARLLRVLVRTGKYQRVASFNTESPCV